MFLKEEILRDSQRYVSLLWDVLGIICGPNKEFMQVAMEIHKLLKAGES